MKLPISLLQRLDVFGFARELGNGRQLGRDGFLALGDLSLQRGLVDGELGNGYVFFVELLLVLSTKLRFELDEFF